MENNTDLIAILKADLELEEKATPAPWEATLSGDAGVYIGLTVVSPACIKFKARVLRPGEDESDMDDLQEDIEAGDTDEQDLTASDRALLQLKENLELAATARNHHRAYAEFALKVAEAFAETDNAEAKFTRNAVGVALEQLKEALSKEALSE